MLQWHLGDKSQEIKLDLTENELDAQRSLPLASPPVTEEDSAKEGRRRRTLSVAHIPCRLFSCVSFSFPHSMSARFSPPSWKVLNFLLCNTLANIICYFWLTERNIVLFWTHLAFLKKYTNFLGGVILEESLSKWGWLTVNLHFVKCLLINRDDLTQGWFGLDPNSQTWTWVWTPALNSKLSHWIWFNNI